LWVKKIPKTKVNAKDIRDAAVRLSGNSLLTPLLESKVLNAQAGARILVKAETLQITGSFKFRGAFNAISQFNRTELDTGVLAFSSGNHAQAIACAAKILNTSALLVMPQDAPKIKLEGTRSHGAEIHTYDRYSENREEIGDKIAKIRGLKIVKPYDDIAVIAGQGTVGLEIIEQCKAANIVPDIIFVPTGGGGLLAGISIAVHKDWPNVKIYSTEPEGWEDHKISLDLGYRRPAPNPELHTICDALLAPIPGEITFPINKAHVTGGLIVDDKEVLHAIASAFINLKIVVEPGGATALAAVMSNKINISGKTVVVVASGGNVDKDIFRLALKED